MIGGLDQYVNQARTTKISSTDQVVHVLTRPWLYIQVAIEELPPSPTLHLLHRWWPSELDLPTYRICSRGFSTA